jgi:hypothetical protein
MPHYDESLFRQAQGATSSHRAQLMASESCGCFYCLELFVPSEIERWLNEGDGTAVCPRCGIDSVLGDASGYPIKDPEFLGGMNRFWF